MALRTASDRMRQRIGKVRSDCTEPAALPALLAIAFNNMRPCKLLRNGSSHGLDPLDQGSEIRIVAQPVPQRPGRVLERLAVDRIDDGHAGVHGLFARSVLEVLP